MAAIKYEKDRAANTLLPNYNTYGRYDIPSYYESYWQSPEERYYTGNKNGIECNRNAASALL
jgi:hypothetical protein